MIFVNFKVYRQGTGQSAMELAKIIKDVAAETALEVIPVVQATDIKEVVEAIQLSVWTQKIDPVSFGAHTGAILAEAVVEDGATGTFINHSESRLAGPDEIKQVVERAKSVGLKTLIFAKDLAELGQVLPFKPDFVAYEPPELIGKTDTSVATAKPDIIKQAAEIAKAAGVPLIVGAGVHSAEDVKTSLQLGAAGVAVSSDIVKSDDPKKELLDLANGFK